VLPDDEIFQALISGHPEELRMQAVPADAARPRSARPDTVDRLSAGHGAGSRCATRTDDYRSCCCSGEERTAAGEASRAIGLQFLIVTRPSSTLPFEYSENTHSFVFGL